MSDKGMVLLRAAKGSFALVYMALEAVRKRSGQYGHSATLKTTDVIDEINRIQKRRLPAPSSMTGER